MMGERSLGHKAATGAIWASIDRFGTMSLQFIVNLILARILIPADFGAIGMLTIFLAVSQVFIDGGFGSALIQKKNPTETDYSTIFYWNLLFSIFLYLILFFISPLVAAYFNMPILSGVLRGIGLTIIINGILAVQKIRLQKSLAFKTLAIANLSSYIIGSIIGVVLAYHNGGVWSLVVMQLTYGLIAIFVLVLITHWLPTVVFSKQSLRELFSFGGYILAANLLQEICRNLQGIIIGKKFSATQMGYYSQANKLEHITSYSIPQVIVQVMYPVYSSIQDDLRRLNDMVIMNMRVVAFLIYPILALLILIAQPLITFLYGEKWLQSVPYFQVLCAGGFFVCLQNLNYYAVAAVGKSKTLFTWSFYKWGFLLTTLLVGMNFGMFGILWGMVLSNFNIFLVNAYLAARHTGLSVTKQLESLCPISCVVIFSFIIAYVLLRFQCSIYIAGIVFVIIFLSLTFGFRIKAIFDIKLLFNKLIRRHL